MGKDSYEQAPSYGFCAAQKSYYYGYKLYGVCELSGVIHSFDLTKAAVHDIHYLQDMKQAFSNCTLIGDRGYLSAPIQLDLFETARFEFSVPYCSNRNKTINLSLNLLPMQENGLEQYSLTWTIILC